jgi:tripartite-type tricarboxylate transporter receptor subunit TctC
MTLALPVAVAAGAGLLVIAGVAPLQAQSPEPFFKGKNITIYGAGPAGSGYDLYARLFARHLGQHLAGNPSVTVANVPGAAGILCANLLYNTAPSDGTALGIMRQTLAEDQAVQTDGVRYDVLKFSWIGRISANVEDAWVWHTVPVKTIDDIKTRETLFASLGGSNDIYPMLLNKMIGTRFKLVKGYSGTPEAELAVQRGEVEGSFGSVNTLKTNHPDWLAKKLISVVYQVAPRRHPFLPQVPAVVEFAKTDADRALLEFLAESAVLGRAIVGPPGIPDDRVSELRAAFDATMVDPAFLADAQKIGAEVSPLPAAELEKVVARTVGISAQTRAAAETYYVR